MKFSQGVEPSFEIAEQKVNQEFVECKVTLEHDGLLRARSFNMFESDLFALRGWADKQLAAVRKVKNLKAKK